ncbi:MAG: hypothetical protein ACJAQ6_000646 [Arenicella sp.]|jgi:hypothetical protein
MKKSIISYILLATSLFAYAGGAFAWGERGHDLITRVAVQNLRVMSDDKQALVKPFVARDHMLAHLSNAPDIVWRAPYMSDLERQENYTTHFINLEKVYQGVALWSDLPADFAVYSKDAEEDGRTAVEVGTAPWRVMQLYKGMVDGLVLAGQAEDKKALEDSVNQALLMAGIMSHFVGDLANPHHTTANYDGQLSGQRGLHAYFESKVLSELSFELSARIAKQAKKNWLKSYSKSEQREILSDPKKLVWALVGNSHSRLPTLLQLDRKYSLIEKSQGEKGRAIRKPVKKTSKRYEKFAVERLSVGAAALSQLWLLAWQQAGSPDLSKFRSYGYPVKPDFIRPDYLLK